MSIGSSSSSSSVDGSQDPSVNSADGATSDDSSQDDPISDEITAEQEDEDWQERLRSLEGDNGSGPKAKSGQTPTPQAALGGPSSK